MDREQEVIHKQMKETRADLTDKLSALENQVSGTVQTATDAVESTKEAVSETVDTVKETVDAVTETVQEAVAGVKESLQETVQTVTESFNLRLQAERHPWAVFGGAVVVGCLGGFLLGGSSRRRRESRPSWEPSRESQTTYGASSHASAAQPQQPEQSGAGGWFWEQLSGLRGLAVGAMMGVARDMVAKAVPETLKEKVTEEVDKLTKSLGGSPLQGSLLPESKEEDESENAKGRQQEFHNDASGMGRSESTGGRSGQPALAGNRR